MVTCTDVAAPRNIKIFPGNVSLSVGDHIFDGTDNRVFDVPNVLVGGRPTPLVLRSSKRPVDDEAALRYERSYAVVASKEKIHPVIYALSILKMPFGCKGYRKLSLMGQDKSLKDLLNHEKNKDPAYSQFLSNPKIISLAVSSVVGCLFRAADLGFCLLDMKPDNILCSLSTGLCYLIDFSREWSFWMPEELVYFFGRTQRDTRVPMPKLGTPCARTRGLSLYLMCLLLYAHLESFFASTDRGSLAFQLVERFRNILWNSCVPLEPLLEYSVELVNRSDADENTIFHNLGLIVRQYFLKKAVHYEECLKWLLLTYPLENKLVGPHCSGKDMPVVVNNILFENDRVSSKGGPREVGIELVGESEYPCPPLFARRIYGVHEGFPYQRVGKVKKNIYVPSILAQ